MTLSTTLQAQIVRLYHAEGWRIGTIAAQLGVHHSSVRRVLSAAGIAVPAISPRGSALDPFVPFIVETFERYPTLSAARLYEMVAERGYTGSPHHFRHRVARYRPRRTAEAYLRLRTLPGEQAQVDWAHFGKLTIGRAQRPLMAFVMVLSYSRHVFVRFYLSAAMASFLRGHVDAFAFFDAVPRVVLYDNLKSAVIERRGQAIHFNPTLLELAAHYRFEPRPVAPYRGNEKGRVERAIRFIRERFLPHASSVTSMISMHKHCTGVWVPQRNARALKTRLKVCARCLNKSGLGYSHCRTTLSRHLNASKCTSARHLTCALT